MDREPEELVRHKNCRAADQREAMEFLIIENLLPELGDLAEFRYSIAIVIDIKIRLAEPDLARALVSAAMIDIGHLVGIEGLPFLPLHVEVGFGVIGDVIVNF